MKERASGSRRLPASAWVFDSALALVAAGLATARVGGHHTRIQVLVAAFQYQQVSGPTLLQRPQLVVQPGDLLAPSVPRTPCP